MNIGKYGLEAIQDAVKFLRKRGKPIAAKIIGDPDVVVSDFHLSTLFQEDGLPAIYAAAEKNGARQHAVSNHVWKLPSLLQAIAGSVPVEFPSISEGFDLIVDCGSYRVPYCYSQLEDILVRAKGWILTFLPLQHTSDSFWLISPKELHNIYEDRGFSFVKTVTYRWDPVIGDLGAFTHNWTPEEPWPINNTFAMVSAKHSGELTKTNALLRQIVKSGRRKEDWATVDDPNYAPETLKGDASVGSKDKSDC